MIVEYRCELSGVADYYKSLDDKKLAALQGTIQGLEGNYLAGMKSLQTKIDGEQNKLAELNAGIVDPDAQANVDAEKIKLQDQSEELLALKSEDVTSIISTTNRIRASLPTDSFNDGNLVTIVRDASEYLSLSTKAGQNSAPSEELTRDENGITSANQSAIYELQESIGLLQSGIAQSAASIQQDKNDTTGTQNRIIDVSDLIKSYQDELAKETAGKAEYFSGVEKSVSAQIQAIGPDPIVRGDELFQWTLADDNTPSLVYAGAEMVHKDGHTDDIAYGYNSVGTVIQLIVQNSMTNYSQYKPQI